ncbi:MAG: RNA methyltransferase [Actinomycetota bacterium]|nr:RNA methyltransferase [Actinomycetota bacterium]
MESVAVPIEIRDPADPRLDDFRDLTHVDRRPDRPGGRGLVIAEGVPVVQRLLASPYPLRAVFGVAPRIAALAKAVADARAPVYVATAEVMAAAVGFHLNRGVLASADRLPAQPVEALLGPARLIAVLEGVNDHENLGSIFRNAAALGVDAVLLGPNCADPLYRRAVRVSMGHVLAVPFADLAGSAAPVPGQGCGFGPYGAGGSGKSPGAPSAAPVPGQGCGSGPYRAGGSGKSPGAPSAAFSAWPAAISALQALGFAVLAMTPNPDARALRDLDPVLHRRTAVLLGAEGPGLSRAALDAADVQVRIPIRPGVDSLNVATAAAIAFAHLTAGY